MKENRTSWAGTSLEVMAVNNQKQTITKKFAMRRIQVNELHVKLSHPGENRMHATKNHLHDSVKGEI